MDNHKGVFVCVDAHTCGNPVRVVVEGGPELRGSNMMEKRLHFMKEFDWVRKGLMFEPRGHDLMSGSILYPAADPANDSGILFIETSGCLPMCGHGTMGTATVMIEKDLVQPKTPGILRLETPAGVVVVEYVEEKGKVRSVKIHNVPSFCHSRDLELEHPKLGSIRFDVAYGGNFYAIVDKQDHFPGFQAFDSTELIALSRDLRKEINQSFEFLHPEDPRISGCSHILWDGDTIEESSTARNAVFYGDKAIDRSPCGTGTSARMAQWHAREKLSVGDEFIHESIVGSIFTGKIEGETKVGQYPAINPSIEGWSRIIGSNTISIDSGDDPFAEGFQVL